MASRTLVLILDELDYDTIQDEIAKRQADSRVIDPTGPTQLPEGESNLAGAILAECCRDLNEYRALYESKRSD